MRKTPIAVTAIAAVLIVTAAAVLLVGNVDALMAWQVDRNIARVAATQTASPGRFEIIFCGTASPQTNADRGQPCLGVAVGGRFFLFDAGQGASDRLNRFQAPHRLLDTIFLTHLHSDHMSGLGEVLHNGWLYGRQQVVQVVGPPGTRDVLDGFKRAYATDIEERQRVLGREYLDSRYGMGDARDVTIDDGEAVVVYERDGVVVKAFRVAHHAWDYAYGYRVEHDGASVVISGDTAYTPAIGRHARNADVLIHEAMNLDLMDMTADALANHDAGIRPDRLARIAEAHTPTPDVARAAAEAEVPRLVLTHLIPPIPASRAVEAYFTRGMGEIYSGEILVARDGMRLSLR